LFERGPRFVRLTTLGEKFSQRVNIISRAVDKLSGLARDAQTGLGKTIRLLSYRLVHRIYCPAQLEHWHIINQSSRYYWQNRYFMYYQEVTALQDLNSYFIIINLWSFTFGNRALY